MLNKIKYNQGIRNGLLFLFICFSSFLTATNEAELPSYRNSSNSILELLNTPNTNPSEEILSSPSASLTYAIGGSSVTTVKQGDVVTITATFDEAMADSPLVQLSGSGVTSISVTNMTKISTTSYTYSWTVGNGDGTQTFALATGTDLEGNVITSSPSSGATIIVDNTAPTAVLTSTDGGIAVSSFNSVNGGTRIITATFSEAMADSPIVQIVGSGFQSIDASTMTKVNSYTYTYYWPKNWNESPGNQVFSLTTGTDVAGNLVVTTPTSGATIRMNMDPTAALTYTIDGSSVGAVNQGDVVTITASFNERMWDSPLAQISGSGINSITATNMTKVSETSYTYIWTVGSGVGTQTFALHEAKDRGWGLITTTPTSGASILVDSPPTASLSYTVGGIAVSEVLQNDVVTITATFNEAMADSPLVQLSGSGAETITATNMTKVSTTTYTYTWTVGLVLGTQTFAFATGTDLAGDVITANPSSGASITVDNTAPKASLAYTKDGNAISIVTQGEVVIITATFSEAMADSPVVQLSGSGAETITATNMTKVSTTSYTYSWTVGAGDGTQTFAFSTGIDLEGNVITASPISGASITLDNTAPTVSLAYTKGSSIVSTVEQGDVITVTATFSEAMADDPVVQLLGSGVTNISATNMTKNSSTEYTYSWTVGSGAGTETFTLATGTDVLGNIITSTPSSGASITIANTAPTASLVYGTTSVKTGQTITIYAQCSEFMNESPAMQITGYGAETIVATNMTRIYLNQYTYSWTVGSNPGLQYFTLSNATDYDGNVIIATPTSGASILIDNNPTAVLSYSVGGSEVSTLVLGDVVTLTATFNETLSDSPVVQISGSGAETIASTNMTKVSSTEYTYTWTAGSGGGTQTFALLAGTDLTGNTITATPTSGATIFYNTVLNSSYEDFSLSNASAIKINAILLTNDNTLSTVPVTNTHIYDLITDLNKAYSELYPSSYWPGFELARITKAYDPNYYFTGNPHGALSDIGAQSVAKQNYLNVVFLDIDADATGIVGSTNLNGNILGANGATLILDKDDGASSVFIHEMGHVIGVNHVAGSWPPQYYELNLQNGSTMGYHNLCHSNVEASYMSAWNSYSYDPYTSLYLTKPVNSLKTPTYGSLFSEAFRSWLINNEYIIATSPSTGYVGNDVSVSVSSAWEGNNEYASLTSHQLFPKIVSSQNSSNNYAAISFLNSSNNKLSYSYRGNDNAWSVLTTIEGASSEFYESKMAMNSNGDVIIITSPWSSNKIKIFYKGASDSDWTNSLVISDSGTSDLKVTRPNISINSAGNAVAVWLRKDNNKTYIVFKERVSGTWSSATALSLEDGKNELPSIAYNDNGDVLVSWQQYNSSSESYEVVGKFRNGSSNEWSSLETYSNTTYSSGFSQTTIDTSGNALVYWRQAEASGLTGVLNIRYRNSDGTLETAVQISGTNQDAFNASAEVDEERVTFLEDGTAAVTWWENDGVNPSRIYTSKMVSKNVWTTPFVLSNSGQNASLSKITVGKGGDYSVIWQRTDGLNTRIQTRMYDADTDAWAPIMTLSDGGSDAFHSDVSYDGNNQLSAIWVRKNGSYYIPEVKTLSSNPFITETTIANDNTSISLSFNKMVYSTSAGSGSLQISDFALSITGGTATLASATPTSISSSGNTYTLGISITGLPSGDEVLTIVPAASNAIYDSTGNAASTTQSSNSIALNDNTAPTASLTYTIGGSIVSNVTENDVVIITATFSKTMKDTPVVQLSGSGAMSMAATNMTKNSSTSYTYTWTVSAGDGTQTFALSTGTDITDNVITSIPTSGASITMHISETTWSGTTDADWGTSSNWSDNVPSASMVAIIPASSTVTIGASTNAVANGISVASGSSLLVSSGGSLTGNITYTRSGLGTDWHLISSPVVGEDVGDVISTTTLANGSGSNLGLSIYNNSTPGWEYYSSTSSGIIESGTGYSLLVNSGDVKFTGTMPIGNVNASTTEGSNRWNLIGNPYPSYIAMNNSADATNFISTNSSNLSSSYVSIYVWNGSSSEFTVINHASDAYDMTPGQGFFVNVNSGVSSVSFTEGMQSHQATETFYRMESDIPTIELATFNGTQTKSTLVKYFENTSSGLDVGYDAGLFTGGNDAFTLSTHLVADSEGIKFALQALNINEFETSIIPVALTAESGLEIVFSLEATSLPENMKVFLQDVQENVIIRLDEPEASYTVSLAESIDGIGRFYIYISGNTPFEGCTDSVALNFDLTAITDDGSCEYASSYPTQQTINLSIGWSMFSTYIDPEITEIDSVLQSIESDLIIVKDYLGNAYLVDWNFNNIGSIQPGQGYQIKALQDCPFIVSGTYLVPSENKISLMEGWNLIGYLLLEPKDATQVLIDILPNVTIVKDYLGNAFLPEWDFNAIGNMQPGQGYQVKMQQDDTLEY